jgi:hypothetical protein
MENPKRFYTYAYLREDGTPYYIGKGQGYRIYSKSGKPCGKPTVKSRIIFLKQNITEEEAFRHEIYMISVFGRKDLGTGILRNKTNGGEGVSGFIITEEAKQNLREKALNRKMPPRSKEYREYVSRIHKGKVLSEETKEKMRKIRTGTNHKQETIEKMRELNAGKNNAFYGKTHTEESKKKISDSKKGGTAPNKNKLCWNNGKIHKYSFECPGNEWVLGRVKKHINSKK